jgi:hypothetical protein
MSSDRASDFPLVPLKRSLLANGCDLRSLLSGHYFLSRCTKCWWLKITTINAFRSSASCLRIVFANLQPVEPIAQRTPMRQFDINTHASKFRGTSNAHPAAMRFAKEITYWRTVGGLDAEALQYSIVSFVATMNNTQGNAVRGSSHARRPSFLS